MSKESERDAPSVVEEEGDGGVEGDQDQHGVLHQVGGHGAHDKAQAMQVNLSDGKQHRIPTSVTFNGFFLKSCLVFNLGERGRSCVEADPSRREGFERGRVLQKHFLVLRFG